MEGIGLVLGGGWESDETDRPKQKAYEMRRVVGRLSLGEMTMFVKEKDKM